MQRETSKMFCRRNFIVSYGSYGSWLWNCWSKDSWLEGNWRSQDHSQLLMVHLNLTWWKFLALLNGESYITKEDTTSCSCILSFAFSINSGTHNTRGHWQNHTFKLWFNCLNLSSEPGRKKRHINGHTRWSAQLNWTCYFSPETVFHLMVMNSQNLLICHILEYIYKWYAVINGKFRDVGCIFLSFFLWKWLGLEEDYMFKWNDSDHQTHHRSSCCGCC